MCTDSNLYIYTVRNVYYNKIYFMKYEIITYKL